METDQHEEESGQQNVHIIAHDFEDAHRSRNLKNTWLKITLEMGLVYETKEAMFIKI
jgi:hypothetical protein